MLTRTASALAAGLVAVLAPAAPATFVNWESPHVSPLALTPDGTRLLAVNTADSRLEVFAVGSAGLAPLGAVPVGVDPVSVRARDDGEAWVVNHLSDSISIVDLDALAVVATLHPGDEPADVVFAGDPLRAFVTVSQRNEVKVYDPRDLAATPATIAIEGEDPRALATDGTRVYAAIFESGNLTTILGEDVVSSAVNPYAGDPNPPPNDGAAFLPALAADLPAPPPVGLIVKRDAGGAWRDDNGADWSAAVAWDLHDHDVAIIDAGTLAVSYATGLMNANMAIAARPGGGATVVGTDALNHVRFEPNLAGTFLRVLAATVGAGGGPPLAVEDLNPHLTYDAPTVAPDVRAKSIGDPRGIAWQSDGARAFVTGLGSSNVVVVDAALGRVARVDVGEGPTGIVLDEPRGRAYVLDKHGASVTIVDTADLVATGQVSFFDPTPEAIRAGRPHLYDTHATSGLGHVSCASCHVDGRMDQLAWDLGDPGGAVQPFDQICNFGILPLCEDWHPMKGPMTSQTLFGLPGTAPFHWRGDRADLPAFNPAFVGLLGADAPLPDDDMAELVAFVTSLRMPPNPFRDVDGSLRASLPGGGDAVAGEALYTSVPLDGVFCVTCHALPTGTNGTLTSADALLESQSMKIPQLRNMHEKTGFDKTSSSANRGFGFIHDGSVDTLVSFLEFPQFAFSPGATGDAERVDLAAFLVSFATDTHAAIGVQRTVGGAATAGAPASVAEMLAIAETGVAGLVAKGVVGGLSRGYHHLGGGVMQSDRAAETTTVDDLVAGAGRDAPVTFTLVPAGSAVRRGVDRDEDGFLDQDEIDAHASPADAASTPETVVPGDVDGNGLVSVEDLLAVLAAWGACAEPCPPCAADLDADCAVGVADVLVVLGGW